MSVDTNSIALQRLLLERVGAIPGVCSTTSVGTALMQGRLSTSMGIRLAGLDEERYQPWDPIWAGPQFFETLGIVLVRGQTFTAADFSNEYRAAPGLDRVSRERATTYRGHGRNHGNVSGSFSLVGSGFRAWTSSGTSGWRGRCTTDQFPCGRPESH